MRAFCLECADVVDVDDSGRCYQGHDALGVEGEDAPVGGSRSTGGDEGRLDLGTDDDPATTLASFSIGDDDASTADGPSPWTAAAEPDRDDTGTDPVGGWSRPAPAAPTTGSAAGDAPGSAPGDAPASAPGDTPGSAHGAAPGEDDEPAPWVLDLGGEDDDVPGHEDDRDRPPSERPGALDPTDSPAWRPPTGSPVGVGPQPPAEPVAPPPPAGGHDRDDLDAALAGLDDTTAQPRPATAGDDTAPLPPVAPSPGRDERDRATGPAPSWPESDDDVAAALAGLDDDTPTGDRPPRGPDAPAGDRSPPEAAGDVDDATTDADGAADDDDADPDDAPSVDLGNFTARGAKVGGRRRRRGFRRG